MTAPEPYTDDDLTPLRRVEGVVYPFRYEVIHRLVATVDSLRAERDGAVGYAREALERLALTADLPIVADGEPRANFYLVDDVEQAITDLRADLDAARADRVCWRETHNQVAAERDALASQLAAIRRRATEHPKGLSASYVLAVMDTPGEDEYGRGVTEFVMRGTPGEDTAPAEPVCATCNDTRRIGTEWDDVGIPCPDCRPVGDLPGDTGNQP